MLQQGKVVERNGSSQYIGNSDIESDSEHQYQETFSTPLQPYTILLKDGETIATMYPIPANPSLLPMGLLAFLLDEFNMEVEKGDSFPYYDMLSLSQFKDVWFNKDGHICIMVLGEIPELDYSLDNDLSDLENNYGNDIETMRHTAQYKKRKERRNLNLNIPWEKQCLGLFSLEPAYPGRSSHIVTGSFLVNAGIRGKGIGKTLVETFVEWSQRLGFTSCCFPLIYDTNVGIRRIFEGLNFRRVGRLPESGILKGIDVPVDSFIYGKEFTHITKSIDLLRDPRRTNEFAKYERLRYYLERNAYPPHCDRNEKARLRVSAKSYYILNGKLMTRGREVIYDPDKQVQIAMDIHLVEHRGINKVTSLIIGRYHWLGIKNTVMEVIAQCPKCKMRATDGTGVVVEPNSHVPQAQMLPHNSITTNNNNRNKRNQDEIDHTSQLSQMAEAVVQTLQDNADKHDTEPTPPDVTVQQMRVRDKSSPREHDTWTKSSLHPDFDGENDNNSNNDTQSMNAFNRFVEEEHARKKQRYLDVAANGLIADMDSPGNNPNIISQDEDKTPGTVPIMEGTDEQIMSDAMLSLEDNVMAAVEMVQQQQQQLQHHHQQGDKLDGSMKNGNLSEYNNPDHDTDEIYY